MNALVNWRARHAQASEVEVELICDEGMISLSVLDNGVGFDPSQAPQMRGRLGLLSMKERVRLVRMTLDIVTAPGSGMHIEEPCRFQGVPMSRPRVLPVDDHSLVFEGFRRILADQCNFAGMVEDGRDRKAVRRKSAVLLNQGLRPEDVWWFHKRCERCQTAGNTSVAI